MIVVSNSSPLITLARVEHLDLLEQLFGRIHIANEVHHEVVVRGAGRAAARTVAAADWIQTHPAADPVALAELRSLHALGAGELATILLANNLNAGLALIDERMARRMARGRSVSVMGCVGVLEIGHRRGLVADLRETYKRLLERGVYIDRQLLNQSLTGLRLRPL